jgi:hypothetical protein
VDLPLVRCAGVASNGYRDYLGGSLIGETEDPSPIIRVDTHLLEHSIRKGLACPDNHLICQHCHAIASSSGWISAATVASVLLSAKPVDVTEQAAINNKTEMQRLVVTAAFISLHDWIDSVDRTESNHHRSAMKA